MIGETIGDSFADLRKYGVIRYASVIDVFKEIDVQIGKENENHLQQLWDENNWDGSLEVKMSRAFESYIRGVLRARIVRSADTYVSLP